MIIPKRIHIIALVTGAAVGLGIGAGYNALNRPAKVTTLPTTSLEAKAAASDKLPACSPDKTALPAGSAQDKLGITLASQLIDVSAGTRLDFGTTSDDGKTVTGSETYGGDWGKYNYVAVRENDSWRVVSLQLCK